METSASWSMVSAPPEPPAAGCCLPPASLISSAASSKVSSLRGDGQQLRACRTDLAACMTPDHPQGTLQDALKGADVFIGLSVGNILTAEDLDLMAADRIVFAMANPDPEVPPELALPTAGSLPPGARTIRTKSTMRWPFPESFEERWMCRRATSMKR